MRPRGRMSEGSRTKHLLLSSIRQGNRGAGAKLLDEKGEEQSRFTLRSREGAKLLYLKGRGRSSDARLMHLLHNKQPLRGRADNSFVYRRGK